MLPEAAPPTWGTNRANSWPKARTRYTGTGPLQKRRARISSPPKRWSRLSTMGWEYTPMHIWGKPGRGEKLSSGLMTALRSGSKSLQSIGHASLQRIFPIVREWAGFVKRRARGFLDNPRSFFYNGFIDPEGGVHHAEDCHFLRPYCGRVPPGRLLCGRGPEAGRGGRRGLCQQHRGPGG